MATATTAAAPAGFCASLYESSKAGLDTGVTWIRDNAKAFTASAGDLFSRIWAAVGDVLSSLGQTVRQWGSAVVDAFSSTKDSWNTLPTNVKWLAAATCGVSLAFGAIVGKCFGGNTPAQTATPPSTAAQTGTAENTTAANPPVQAGQQQQAT